MQRCSKLLFSCTLPKPRFINTFARFNATNKIAALSYSTQRFNPQQINFKNGVSQVIELARSGKRHEALELFNTLRNNGYKHNIKSYCLLMSKFKSNLQILHSLYQQLEQDGIIPDSFVASLMVNAIASTQNNPSNIEQAKLFLLNLLNRPEISLTDVPFNTLMNAIVKSDSNNNKLSAPVLVEQAQEIFKMMLEKKIIPTVKTFSILVEAFVNADQFDKAEELITLMTSTFKIQMDVQLVTILVDAYMKNNMREKALQFIFEQQAKGVDVTEPLYALISGYCRTNQISKATAIINSMIEKNMKLTPLVFQSLLRYYASSKDMTNLQKTFNWMLQQNVAPDSLSYTALIEAHISNADIKSALQVLNTMQSNNVVPTTITYSIIIKYYLAKKDFTRAEAIFDSLAEQEQTDTEFCNLILEAFVKNNMRDRAMALFLKMKKMGQVNTDTYKLLRSFN